MDTSTRIYFWSHVLINQNFWLSGVIDFFVNTNREVYQNIIREWYSILLRHFPEYRTLR
jgi:hypothetical protein